MEKNKKISIIVSILVVLGISIYYSPFQSNWILHNPEYPIRTARNFAQALINGNEIMLSRVADETFNESLKDEIESLDHWISTEEILNKCNQLPSDKLILSCWRKRDKASLDLMAFERTGNEKLAVVTFVYKFNDGSSEYPDWNIAYIPGRGPLLITVGLQYFDSDWAFTFVRGEQQSYILLRKVLNLPLIRKFTESKGLTGKWVVDMVNYNYDLNDYFDWVIEDAQNQQELTESTYDEKTQRTIEFLESLLELEESPEFLKYQDKFWNYHLSWLVNKVSSQFEEIQQVIEYEYKLSNELLNL